MELFYIILLVTMCELGNRNTIKGQHSQVGLQSSLKAMDTSNFDQLVQSKTFVDKTLMIKEVFKSPHHTYLILAPRKFGKTSNMNMIKRFCEVEVDENGNPKDITLTTSYATFKSKRLQIFKDEAFVNEHFASYPVLHLDYSSLQNIDSYDHLFEKLIILISRTFAEHNYLLKNESLWDGFESLWDGFESLWDGFESLWDGFEKGLFQSYVSAKENHKDHNTHILTSLKWLVEILHKHFNRKVLVLIDEFDACVYSAIFKDSKGIDKVLQLMIEIDGNLLRPNDHVSKVILTGALKVYRQDMNKDIWTYHFLEDHPFSPYYGLTKDELDTLLSKLVGNCGEKYQLLKYILSYYGSYKIYSENSSITEIYNIWSVINYALQRKNTTDYLVGPENLLGFKTIFKAQKVKEQLQALLLGDNVHVDRNLPFKEEDIRTLNYIVKSYISPPSGVEVFLRLLYSFGYLTQVKENEGIILEEFKIPNNETYDELMRYTPC